MSRSAEGAEGQARRACAAVPACYAAWPLSGPFEALGSAAKAASSRPSAPATTGKAAPAGEPSAARQAPKVDPQERRAQLGDLMNEYRRRLSELQAEQGTADPAERLAARRQVREWYLARRRALLLGKPLPD